MIIIGNGQLATAFRFEKMDNVTLFASGVSNSNCTDNKQFLREKTTLLNAIHEFPENRIVYFSSCALSAPKYPKNQYYTHKKQMEELIQNSCNKYVICRIPQLFGDLIVHKTLINFLYKSIIHKHEFHVFDNAYRYVIEIKDLKYLVITYIQSSEENSIIDFANPYRYHILDIVKVFEELLNINAKYSILKKSDYYSLDLTKMQNFIEQHDISVDFGEQYLYNKLKSKLIHASVM